MDAAKLFDVIRPTFPGGRLTQTQVDGINSLLPLLEYDPISHQSYVLATAQHETAHTMRPIYERGSLSYFDKYEPGTRLGIRLGNTEKGDGFRFRGAGYVQITGRANFARAGKELNVDLIGKPELALDPTIAAQILRQGMRKGWFTGKRLYDYLPGSYRQARRIVNGMDRADHIAALAETWERGLRRIR